MLKENSGMSSYSLLYHKIKLYIVYKASNRIWISKRSDSDVQIIEKEYKKHEIIIICSGRIA